MNYQKLENKKEINKNITENFEDLDSSRESQIYTAKGLEHITEEYYTEEEIKMLDKFHALSENKFTDDEIYDVMVRFNKDEELIKNEINQMLKEMKRGDEFNWTEIGKSNSIFF